MHFQSINMCLFKKPKLFIFRHYFTQSRLMNLEHTPITETNQLFQIISTFHLKSIHNMASFLEYYICSNPSGFFSLTKHHGCSSQLSSKRKYIFPPKKFLYKLVLQRVMNYLGTRKYQVGGCPARNRFFEICHYPDPAQNRVLLPRGYPGN